MNEPTRISSSSRSMIDLIALSLPSALVSCATVSPLANAHFITGKDIPGSLHQIDDQGLFAFIRLVGTMYFKKHLSAFVSLFSYETSSIKQKHQEWLNKIREVVSERC